MHITPKHTFIAGKEITYISSEIHWFISSVASTMGKEELTELKLVIVIAFCIASG